MSPLCPIPAPQRLRLVLLFISAFSFQFSAFTHAQDAADPAPSTPPPTPTDDAFERFRHGTLDLATLAEVLPQLPNKEYRPVIRATLLEAKAPPRADLVALLKHPALAVRLGALELLEELAGGDLAFNPWTPAEAPENLAALARWQAWAGATADAPHTDSLFSDEQRRAYLRDLLAEDIDKASRARRMLEAEGLAAVGFLETFLKDTPTLPPGSRARIREAQYQITLARQLGDQAGDTARQLAFGSRDQLLAALATVRSAGSLALPILRDFITHPDPLVRETAIDALLVSGGEPAVAIIAPLLAKEPDVNVIHGALRRLKDIPGPETEKLVGAFLSHADEDLLISAIQTSLTLSGDNKRYSSGSKKKSPTADPAVLQALSDPRWRVRATALEYVAKRKVSAAKDSCLTLLEDPDEFVRFAAIKAIVALGAKDALPKLKAMFLANPAMAGPVIEGYGALNQPLDADILTKLDAAPPDARLAALRSTESNKSLASLALRYAADANLDVACAALRIIAADDNALKTNKAASVVVAALRSNTPEKTAAILERLDLPSASSKRLDPLLVETLNSASTSGEPTALDPLYDAFLEPGKNLKASRSEPATPNIPAAQAELIREIAKRCTPDTPPGLRFSAAINLAKADQTEGFTALIRDLPTQTTAQKIAICDNLNSPSNRAAIPLLTTLLRDPVSEVRSAAAARALSNDKAKALIHLVIEELGKPGSPLQPAEAYGYRFEYAARDSAAIFRPWCLGVLQARDSAVPLRILAMIASRHCPNTPILAALKNHTSATDPKLRRAAWHALLCARPAELSASAEALAKDPEAFVRAVLPEHAAKTENLWLHQFSDTQLGRETYSNYNEKQARLDDGLRAVLKRLAEHDPAPLIRFEAGFALIAQGVPIDLEAFLTLLPHLAKDTHATDRLTGWLEQNAGRATPALRPLLAVINPARIRPDKLQLLNARISPALTNGFATFASLAETAATPTAKDTPVLTEAPAAAAPTRNSLEIVFFYKPGCPECVKTQQLLNNLKRDFPLLKLTASNILEASGTVLNQALCGRFSVPSLKHSLTPAVFTQAGFVIGTDISPATLGKLMAQTMAEPQDDTWSKLDAPEQLAAAQEVDRRYQAVTLPIVVGGGLLDGINPCAFATIIFFLSYLQIARRSPREMLMVGAAFISAVFIAYLAAGLLLYEMLDKLSGRFAGIQWWLNLSFGLLALFAAWLSLRDALRARAGRLDAMTLQLPGFLKERIRGVIRSGARARNFVIAAFLSGLVISMLELACTGQVYAPIIYQIQKGRLDAVLWLVIYNLAFIAPLIVIFLLAYGGLRSETLITFQKRHTCAVKLGLALLFLFLALFIFFGTNLVPAL
ncbi:MAG: HEAT repeat domain-containing protein [Verrucomicrobiota bacterium]